MSLIALIPLAALFGFLGLSSDKTSASANGLELHVEYPDTLRYGTSHLLVVTLGNPSAESVGRPVLRIDDQYLSAFAEVQLTPQAQVLRDGFYEVELSELGAGQTQRVVVDLQAEVPGRHGGRVLAVLGESPAVEVEVSTFILP